MGYTYLGNGGRASSAKLHSLERASLDFIRNRCEELRFDSELDEQEKRERCFYGTSLKKGQIPYNQQMDTDRLCLENAVSRFLKSGTKADAFDVYFCYLEMFVGKYEKTRRMIELLSEYESSGSNLLMKHRDHYSHSVYVFILGLAIYESNSHYRQVYQNYYGVKDEKKAAHHYLYHWGMTSLFHDIGYPFELPFEQVSSYFEVEGDERSRKPFVSYRNLDAFTKLDKAMQRTIARIYGLGTDKILHSTDELFAYVLSQKLSDVYYCSEQELLELLRNKPTNPNQFGYFMDHAYFSATVLFKKLFCEMDCELTADCIDALTAILLHNSLYKFGVAFYKDKRSNIPFQMELHPLAFMLMLCDELQCWDRTAYGRNSRLEIHPMDCEFDLSNDSIHAVYLFDRSEKEKINAFEQEYKQWESDHRGSRPKRKAYSSMYQTGDSISDFQKDIMRILDLSGISFSVTTRIESRSGHHRRGKVGLSDSNYMNLYNFAVVLNGRWGLQEGWKKAVDAGQEEVFLTNPQHLRQFEEGFRGLSLEYKLSNLNQAKAFAVYMNEIGCFYTDKPVDFDMLESVDADGKRHAVFTPEEAVLIGKMEHRRWLQEHIDMGWSFGNPKKEERELVRTHKDMIPKWTGEKEEVSVEEAEQNYLRIGKTEQDKDIEPMECMVSLLKMYDGLRIYRFR